MPATADMIYYYSCNDVIHNFIISILINRLTEYTPTKFRSILKYTFLLLCYQYSNVRMQILILTGYLVGLSAPARPAVGCLTEQGLVAC